LCSRVANKTRHAAAFVVIPQYYAFELSGHFVWDKWQTNAEQLIDTMIALLPTEK
jgi:hypothetical protein